MLSVELDVLSLLAADASNIDVGVTSVCWLSIEEGLFCGAAMEERRGLAGDIARKRMTETRRIAPTIMNNVYFVANNFLFILLTD